MEEGDFRPPIARKPLDRFSWYLKYITTSRKRPRNAKFQWLRRRGWFRKIASLTHESFFFCLFMEAAGRISGHTPRAIRHYTSFWPRYCLSAVTKMKFEIWPFYWTPKTVKIGTLSWRPIENCSRPSSGTVTLIQFKLGTGIEHLRGITWHNFKVKRSKIQVTTSRNVSRKIAITQHWVVVSSSYWEANMRTTPTRGAQIGCHGNAGCLATGPLNLQFMI